MNDNSSVLGEYELYEVLRGGDTTNEHDIDEEEADDSGDLNNSINPLLNEERDFHCDFSLAPNNVSGLDLNE